MRPELPPMRRVLPPHGRVEANRNGRYVFAKLTELSVIGHADSENGRV
jgi:hypothetical protein